MLMVVFFVMWVDLFDVLCGKMFMKVVVVGCFVVDEFVGDVVGECLVK